MAAYKVTYKRDRTDPCSSNLVWADDYEQIRREFDGCAWFAAHVSPEWEVRECRAKGMPERWLQ